MLWNNDKIVHPLFNYTLAFAYGILVKYLNFNSILVLSIVFFSLSLSSVGFFYNLEKQKNIKSYLLILFFLLGFLRFYLWEKNDYQIQEFLKSKLDYTAQVIDINDYSHPFFKHKLLLKLNPFNKKSIQFKINLYLPHLNEIKIADQLIIKDLKFNSPRNPQGSLYSNESIIPKLFTSSLSFCIDYRPKFSFYRNIKETKSSLAKKIRSKMSKTSGMLFEYIFLGLKNSSDLADTMRDKFNYWGIAHYLARSGLHVVMIIFLWSLFLKFIPLPFFFKQSLLTLLSLIYSLLSWPSTSFERALLTFLLVQVCLVMKLPFRSSYLITLCSLLFLIINPIYLFLLDFQLSFGLTLGISLFNEIQNKNF